MNIRRATLDDLELVYEIEKECFPASEAASYESLKWRIENDFFLILEDKDILSFINGMPSNEKDLKDEMYEGKYFDPNGDWLMIFGVDTPIQHQHHGYASQTMKAVIQEFKGKGIVLTCKEHLLDFYAQFGFENEGISSSVHGNVTWYQMRYTNPLHKL
ncbi:MAG: GNAT family N-acetyltransferase [Floccifex sp.]